MNETNEHPVIAIARQMGSGGAYLGQRIARRMGIAYLDRQALDETVERLQVSADDPTRWADRSSSLLDCTSPVFTNDVESEYVPPPLLPADRRLHEMQEGLMRELSDRGDCVIVGRGATMALRGRPATIRIFLHARREWRVRRVAAIYGMSSARAEFLVRNVDAEREQFYQNQYRVRWTDAANYDLALNIGAMGFDAAERAIVRFASRRHALSHLGGVS